MTTVYLVWHSHEVAGEDDDKLIGVYSTSKNASAAIERLKKQPGFKEYPDGFLIDEYEVDQHNWTEGFITSTDAVGCSDEGRTD